MNLLVTHRRAFFIGAFGLFVTLLLHDWNLYPNLRPYGVPLLSAIRFILLTASFVFGLLLVRAPKTRGLKRGSLWFAWLFFLPYTIYSVTEIRHVAELCRLAMGVYTDSCVGRLWTLYPVFIYALAGTIVFTFTLSCVATKLIPSSSVKRAFILSICAYTSAASVFGLYSRFNVWDAFLQPLRTVYSIGRLMSEPSFYVNVTAYFLFTSILFFVLNRILYRAHRHIFE